MFAPAQILSLEHTAHPKLFEDHQYVWNALKQIASYLQFRLKPAVLGELIGRPFISANVFVGRGTVVEQGAVLKGPAWIGENCQIRSGCYVRENVVVGNGVVMGNSCEFKNSIIFDEAQVPHFNYVGDSILGFKAHLGAGVILSNVKLDHSEIAVATKEGNIATGLTKFGAIVGDRTEIGCNAVINPGSVLGRDCLVYPNVNFRGVLPDGYVAKLRQQIQVLERRSRGK
ncbi:MAG TPA: UDP-N-acetylglucosamine diphosphorylase [Chthoniobacterales bacterium]|jgi:bifunctional UDP-N-acetylglucosamine pyrophosphorylase / glucosamine-1-phosphate N-acetyltransferase|nr:UDP-N-acetylglucosamine diphosphorylase [Chthoniobacterales bacterium]